MEKIANHEDLHEIFPSKQIFSAISDSETSKLFEMLSEVKIQLILDLPFFGYLVSHFRVVITDNKHINHFAIDNKYIYFQKNYLQTIDESIRKNQARIDLTHLIMHFIYHHIFRQKHHIPKLWSLACDIVVYQALDQLFLEWPNFTSYRYHLSHLLPNEYLSQSSEKVYLMLLEEMERQKRETEASTETSNNDLDGFRELLETLQLSKSDLCDIEHVTQFNDKDDLSEQIIDGLLVSLYQQFSNQGNIPEFLEIHLRDKFESRINWRTQLSIYIQNVLSNDTTWSHPNRKYLSRNIYLPSLLKEDLTVIVAIDTSQSISDLILSKFASETVSLTTSLAHVKIILVQCDMSIQSIHEFNYGEFPVVDSVKGRGGTDFRPVFNLIPRYEADLLIYLTDGDGILPTDYNFPIPVIWILTQKIQLPFGQLIYI